MLGGMSVQADQVRLVVEVLWPLFLFFILVWVRSTNKPFYKGQCHYPNKAMPSAGVLPWLQGMMCDIDNPCLSYPTPGETPGQVNNFNNSIISGMLIELQVLVANRSILSKAQLLADAIDQWNSVLSQSTPGKPVILRSILRDNETFSTHLEENLSVPPRVVQSLMNAEVKLSSMMDIPRPGNLKSILCEGTDLAQYVQFNSQAEKEAFQNVSCSLTPQQLINTRRVFLQNLDPRKVLSELPLDLNATDRATLMKLTQDALPVIEEMARLRNSVAFKAVSTLDFQRDMFGSINKLLCDKEPDFNSTRMHVSSRSKQMANNKAIFIMGNSSVVFVVMVAIKWTKQTNNITGHGN
ncbi:ATP-binding cassette sub-family A member 1 [Larimichthys crocea]|uniref:ATP-binding cassette sub-family A member 1 n=1 Tax=Larimichthys crocea TaxID=215358 RepID=A0A6G0HJJ0_LARCR|nr:ATP-binding cassette sub-family A member 1 [Larimichthys crocea]